MLVALYLVLLSIFFFGGLLFLFKAVKESHYISILFSVLVVTASVTHFGIPALQEHLGYYRYQSSYGYVSHMWSMLYAFVFLVALIFFWFALFKPAGTHRDINRELLFSATAKSKFSIFLYVFLLLLVIPAFIVSFSNLKSIVSMGHEYYMANRIEQGTGRGFFVLFPHFVPLFSICVFVYLLLYHRVFSVFAFIFYSALFIVSFTYSFLYFSATGSRNTVFILLMNCVVSFFLIKNKISWMHIVASVVVLCITVSIFSFMGLKRKEVLGYQGLDEKGTVEIVVEGVNGAFGNNENTVWMIDNDYTSYLVGSTYLAAPLNFIPRSVWAGKPLGGGPKLVNSIYPGSYVVGRAGVSSLTTGLLPEAYMNFGYLGAVVIPFVFCFMLWSVKKVFDDPSNPVILSLVSYLCVALGVSFVQAEFLGLFTRMGFILFGFLMCFVISSFLSSRSRTG